MKTNTAMQKVIREALPLPTPIGEKLDTLLKNGFAAAYEGIFWAEKAKAIYPSMTKANQDWVGVEAKYNKIHIDDYVEANILGHALLFMKVTHFSLGQTYQDRAFKVLIGHTEFEGYETHNSAFSH